MKKDEKLCFTDHVSVAQLDRVSASDAEGCEFEPRRIRHFGFMISAYKSQRVCFIPFC